MKTNIARHAIVSALLTTLYITLIASFVFYVPKALGLNNKPDTVMAPIVMLSLLVFSASVVGLLIFGRPAMWYLDGHQKEALRLVIYTLLTFFITTSAIFLAFFAYIK